MVSPRLHWSDVVRIRIQFPRIGFDGDAAVRASLATTSQMYT